MNDLDEMKKIWNDLDQKINVTEQANAKIVKNIQTHQFKSVLDKIYSRRLHEMFFCILFFALVLPLYQVYRGFNIVVFIAEELVLFLTTIGLFFQLIFVNPVFQNNLALIHLESIRAPSSPLHCLVY